MTLSLLKEKARCVILSLLKEKARCVIQIKLQLMYRNILLEGVLIVDVSENLGKGVKTKEYLRFITLVLIAPARRQAEYLRCLPSLSIPKVLTIMSCLSLFC